jgi:hypothetical protein
VALEFSIAQRSVPTPESAVEVTVKVAAEAKLAQPPSSDPSKTARHALHPNFERLNSLRENDFNGQRGVFF